MSIDKNSPNPKYVLAKAQINELARPLVRIVEEYYKDPKNEEAFQKWLKEQEQPPKPK